MRLIFWGLVVVACCYAAYAGMMAVWSYFQVAGTVDEVLPQSSEPIELKRRILHAVNEAGIPLSDREVSVTKDERGGVHVQVVWALPVVVVKGESVLAVPLSLTRTKLEPVGMPTKVPSPVRR